MVDKDKIKKAVTMIIEAIGEDPEREGLKETPDRISRMYEEIFKGLEEDPKEHLSKTFFVEENNLVLEKDIQFYSMCEHHFLPFYGKTHVAYIPNGKVAGLSKLARTVDVFAKRPQIQEKMSLEIAKALMEHLDAKGVMIVVEAEHLCMSMRGIKKPGATTVTIVTKGAFEKNIELQKQVLELIKM